MNPLVSVIVPTYNSAATIAECLESIREQTYQSIELIVVDNHSVDATAEIARRYTDLVFIKGPERSTQRNFGVEQANGTYVCIIDSDMELSPEVISQCMVKMHTQPTCRGIIIPEQSFGEGFWAQCKQLERSFYVGVDWMEAARFFDRATYLELGGYDSRLISGEDWDLSQRVAQISPLGRIEAFIYHNEGRLRLGTTLRKKYYYAQAFVQYMAKQEHAVQHDSQTSVLGRYKLFFSKPKRLLAKPHIGLGMLLMKTCEFSWGAIGYYRAKKSTKETG